MSNIDDWNDWAPGVFMPPPIRKILYDKENFMLEEEAAMSVLKRKQLIAEEGRKRELHSLEVEERQLKIELLKLEIREKELQLAKM